MSTGAPRHYALGKAGMVRRIMEAPRFDWRAADCAGVSRPAVQRADAVEAGVRLRAGVTQACGAEEYSASRRRGIYD